LIRAANQINAPKKLSAEQKIGFNIVLNAAKKPLRNMAENAEESPDIIVHMVENTTDHNGYDFTSSKIVNMLEAGIVDPVMVTACALKNAISAASTLITTNYAIIETE